MSDALVDVLILSLFCAVVFGTAAVGVLALPWKDDELVATTRTLRRGWRRLDHGLVRLATAAGALGGTPGAAAAPRAPERAERATVAFERPTAPA